MCFGAERLAALVIHANHLLVPRDDSRFYRGDAFGISDDAFGRDIRDAQAFLQRTPGLVIPNHSKRFHFRAERGNVGGHVPRTAQAFALLHEIHDGNRRFRRKPRRRAPQVAVQHRVAKHADALPAQARNQSLQPGERVGNIGGHAVSLIFCRTMGYSSATFASSDSMTGISSRTG